MSAGVWLCLDDAATYERVVSAIESSADLYIAASEDSAHVLLSSASMLARSSVPVVVLATRDHVRAAREALRFGASGIVAWPEEAPVLTERLLEAAMHTSSGEGLVVSVVGARGGCGASTLVAYLAQAAGSQAIIIDLSGSEAGQLLFARTRPDAFLTKSMIEDPSTQVLRRLAHPHASGASCVYGANCVATQSFTECLKRLAPVVIVDGLVPDASVCVLVLSRDSGSIRAARSMMSESTRIVLCSPRRGRLSARDVKRGIGVTPYVIPHDARVTRASDHGRMCKRGFAQRSIAKLARELLNER
ncbi:MAG: hypothetical protein ACYDCC_12685 [Actinomycetota bacterium]